MDTSDVSLALAPCHLSLPATSHSFLSPSSALLPDHSESSHRSHHDEYPPRMHEKPQRKPFKSTLMDSLRYRFPDGRPPQALYDEFIQVTLNDVPPDSALVDNANPSNENETHHVSPVQRLQRMTSRVFATIAASITSRPALPLHNPRPVISNPRPMEASATFQRGRKPRTPSPSPVQFYTQAFNGVGPPPPLPSPSDIRQPSRAQSRSAASRSQSASRSHSACSQTKHLVPEVPTRPEPVQLATKNSVVFPRAPRQETEPKTVRIITPRTHGASYVPTAPAVDNTPKASSILAYLSLAAVLVLLRKTKSHLLRILTFSDPAESLFHLGFITGPQTWLLGGWYLTSTSTLTSADLKDGEGKSQLRVWVDKCVHVEKSGHGDELLERIERAERGQGQVNASSSGLTSSSFEIGRRTVTDSNASGLRGEVPLDVGQVGEALTTAAAATDSLVFIPHFRSSRAVWSASKMSMREYASHGYGDDEISVNLDLEHNQWVHRCRIAALISGLVVMSLFISALTVVCLR